MTPRINHLGRTVRTPPEEDADRQKVGLEWMTRSFLGLWALAVVCVVGAFVSPPRDALRASDWQLDAGRADGFAVGQPRMIHTGPEPVWVFRLDDRTFSALSAVCTYRHCVLRWDPTLGLFSCPCHQGRYGLDGRVVAGPAETPLRSFHVRIKSGRVRVHLRRPAGGEL